MKTVKFLVNPVKFNLAYFAGDVVDFPDNYANELIEAGQAEEVVAVMNLKQDLPIDIPARDKLIDAGVLNLDTLRQYTDFTEIKGIGKKTAEAISNYLK